MPDVTFRVSSSWKSLVASACRVSSVWKKFVSIDVRVSGVWKHIWPVPLSTDMLCFFTVAPDSGDWQICNGGGGTSNLHQKFPKADSTTPGGTGGSNVHSHANTNVTSGGFAPGVKGQTGIWTAMTTLHTHTLNHNHSNTAYPPFRAFYAAVAKASTVKIPTNGYLLWIDSATAPPGWTKYASYNSYYIRITTSGTPGSLNSPHTHSYSLGWVTGGAGQKPAAYSPACQRHANHAHAQTHTHAATSILPLRVDVCLIRPNAPTSIIPSGAYALFKAAPPTGWTVIATYDGRYLRIATGTPGGIGGSSTHACPSATPTCSSWSNTTALNKRGAATYWRCEQASHYHTVSSHNHAAGASTPPYVEYRLCRKD